MRKRQTWAQYLVDVASWPNVRPEELRKLAHNVVVMQQGHRPPSSKHARGRRYDPRMNHGRTSQIGMRRSIAIVLKRMEVEGMLDDE